ncbi:hypothetical protein FRB95_000484 [Tulasnella sp. JGI-2019a]|nr:hypothetical protein FRB95_000484 [Tulasnella sp. JGI-2019a]
MNGCIDQVLACLVTEAQNGASLSSDDPEERGRLLQETYLLQTSYDMLGQRIRRRIANTNRRLNSRVLINRLPNELLVRIFAFTSTIDQYLKHLVWIGLVSKDWSRIVFEAPSLWAQISSSYNFGANEAAVLRSKGHPLLVDCNEHDCWNVKGNRPGRGTSFMTLATEEAYRWQVVTFDLAYESTLGLFRNFVSISAPRLEELKINCRELDNTRSLGESINIFGGGTNRLRRLDLFQFPIPWGSQVLSGLETLKISADHLSHRPSTSMITDILRRCLNLVTFELQYIGEVDTDVSVAVSKAKTVDLPSLTSFTLDLNDAVAFRQIVASVRVPACTTFVLGCRGTTGNIFRNAAEHLTAALVSIIRPISTIELRLSAFDLALTVWHDSYKPIIDIYVDHSSPWEDLAWLINPTVTGSSSWPPINAHISCDDSLPFRQVVDLLREMPSIRSLELVGNSDRYIAQLAHPTLDGIYNWILPNLRELRLDSCPRNSLELLVELQRKRQGGIDMDRGDDLTLFLPRKLEVLYVRRPDGFSRVGPFYTAFRELYGEHWGTNLLE